ncbi:MAG: ATP-binding protein [Candidatus Edwardsbacteria bacterium]
MTQKKLLCWQFKNCSRTDCPAYGRDDCCCWLIGGTLCGNGKSHSLRQKIKECCRECDFFLQMIQRATGRREVEKVIINTLDIFLEELTASENELTQTNQQLKERLEDLTILDEVTKTLQKTLQLDQVFHIILTGMTARQALGLNRAFLCLINEKENVLEGKKAVGPSSGEEASKIWKELETSPRTFEQLAFNPESESANKAVNELVRKIRIPLSLPEGGIFARTVLEKKSFNIKDAEKEANFCPLLCQLLGSTSFALVPLVYEEKPLGLLIADNLFSGRSITNDDISLMEIYAGQVSSAIRNAQLYESLQNKIKELEATQELLVKTEKIAAVGEMAQSLAHEIRNPLVSIGGFVRSIYKETPLENPNRKYLGIVLREVERLEETLDDIFRYTSSIKPEMQEENLNEIIEEAILLLEPEMQAKGIKTHLEIDFSLPKIWFDTHQLRHVFLNLFKNSIHAMSKGGELFIKNHQHKNFVEIEISDTGTGISQEDLNKIFTPYYTTKRGGVGLGLAISHQVVQNHGGSIEVKSEKEGGTTFLIRLPFEKRKTSSKEQNV